MYSPNTLLTVAIAFGLVLTGCDSCGTSMEEEPERQIMFEQTFDSSTDGWITDETSGPTGWCGDIAHASAKEGAVEPSGGSGYALAALGKCNEFYQENGFPASGPFGPFGEYNDEVGFQGEKGFVKELDVYLDPSTPAPDTSVFTYVVSFDLLDTEFPDNFRYHVVPVVKPDQWFIVAGEQIKVEGWYTFRHRFTSDNGSLSIDFELLRDGEVVASQNVSKTTFSRQDMSSFETSNVGTGYAWFFAIKPGYDLPIDEHKLVREE